MGDTGNVTDFVKIMCEICDDSYNNDEIIYFFIYIESLLQNNPKSFNEILFDDAALELKSIAKKRTTKSVNTFIQDRIKELENKYDYDYIVKYILPLKKGYQKYNLRKRIINSILLLFNTNKLQVLKKQLEDETDTNKLIEIMQKIDQINGNNKITNELMEIDDIKKMREECINEITEVGNRITEGVIPTLHEINDLISKHSNFEIQIQMQNLEIIKKQYINNIMTNENNMEMINHTLLHNSSIHIIRPTTEQRGAGSIKKVDRKHLDKLFICNDRRARKAFRIKGQGNTIFVMYKGEIKKAREIGKA
jgi:hypothetical protein